MLDPFVSTRDPETDRPALCRVSQRHLELLETCPRKFQYTFLDRAIAPPRAESQTAIEAGSRFHLLVQQRELGLPIDILMAGNPQLQQWMDTLLTSVPELCVDPLPPRVFRQAEHERTFPLNGFALNVRYDLLVADEMQAQILDWKTYPKPQNRQKLAQSWQTRLYPYVLVETSQYVPEQVVMTYWYVRARHRSPEADVSGRTAMPSVYIQQRCTSENSPGLNALAGSIATVAGGVPTGPIAADGEGENGYVSDLPGFGDRR
jgi:PD-(D/E)XK nuclease superfamily